MYVLMIYLALMPVAVDSFKTESDCMRAAIQVTEFLIKTGAQGKAWCESGDVKT